jgi:predicted transposase YdaD
MTAKPYDPTLKALVETDPKSWPALLGHPTGPTEVIDADIATVSGAADKVLHIAAAVPYLLHLEFVTGHDVVELPGKLHVRNSLLTDRHGLRVRSAAVLLQPEADSPQLTGIYELTFPDEEPYLTFRYQVLRVWQLPPESLLRGGFPLLALAPISAVTEAELPGIIERMDQCLRSRRGRKQAPRVWAAAYILLGLRYSAALAAQLFRGVVSMRESATYQAILEEGRTVGRSEGRAEGAIAEARKLLRVFGDRAFGAPDEPTATTIEQIADLARLEDLFRRASSVTSWQELLAQPTGRSGRGRRRNSP